MIVKHDPIDILIRQIDGFYSGGVEKDVINAAYSTVICKLENCFSYVKNKYYHDKKDVYFNPLHTAQWTMFLYEMSHEISKYGYIDLSDKIYGISKMISSADIFYGVDLPDIYFFDQPQGSVIGRASYSNFFTFSQGCTVGNNKGIYPVLGEHVSMFSGSKILGNCHVGDHVIFSANSYIIDQDIPSYSIVFGMGKDVTIKHITQEKFDYLTKVMF